jgi:hypothetical protein
MKKILLFLLFLIIPKFSFAQQEMPDTVLRMNIPAIAKMDVVPVIYAKWWKVIIRCTDLPFD